MLFQYRRIEVNATVDMPDLVEEIVCASDTVEVADFIKALDDRIGSTDFTASLIFDLCESLRLDNEKAFLAVIEKIRGSK